MKAATLEVPQRSASCRAQHATVQAEASLRYAAGRAVRDAVRNLIDYCPRRPHASNDGAHPTPWNSICKPFWLK